jgi:hypothetical protein
VCGRTLLRGEHPDPYIAGGERRWVCDLCTSRALNEGWVREGTVPDYDRDSSVRERRRSLLGRFRSRRADGSVGDLFGRSTAPSDPAIPPPLAGPREPRHVRAVPTNVEHKVASAIEVFNRSEHARRIAGVARSLGAPGVSVLPSDASTSVVRVVASWELCWYRYEIDLADELPDVRVEAQGAELDELGEDERTPNATADADGLLTLR